MQPLGRKVLPHFVCFLVMEGIQERVCPSSATCFLRPGEMELHLIMHLANLGAITRACSALLPVLASPWRRGSGVCPRPASCKQGPQLGNPFGSPTEHACQLALSITTVVFRLESIFLLPSSSSCSVLGWEEGCCFTDSFCDPSSRRNLCYPSCHWSPPEDCKGLCLPPSFPSPALAPCLTHRSHTQIHVQQCMR